MNRTIGTFLFAAFAAIAVLFGSVPSASAQSFDPSPTIYSPNAYFYGPITLPVSSADTLTSVSLAGWNTIKISCDPVSAATPGDLAQSGIVYNIWSNNTPGGMRAAKSGGESSQNNTPLALCTGAITSASSYLPWSRIAKVNVASTTKVKAGMVIEVRDASNSWTVIARGVVKAPSPQSNVTNFVGPAVPSATQFIVEWLAAPSATIASGDKVFLCRPDLTADDGVKIMAGETQYITVPPWAQQYGNICFTSFTTNKPVVVNVTGVATSQIFFN